MSATRMAVKENRVGDEDGILQKNTIQLQIKILQSQELKVFT